MHWGQGQQLSVVSVRAALCVFQLVPGELSFWPVPGVDLQQYHLSRWVAVEGLWGEVEGLWVAVEGLWAVVEGLWVAVEGLCSDCVLGSKGGDKMR